MSRNGPFIANGYSDVFIPKLVEAVLFERDVKASEKILSRQMGCFFNRLNRLIDPNVCHVSGY